MFKHILVPLDGSERAERTLPIAARIARASGAVMHLVQVVQGLAEYETGMAPPVTWAPASAPRDRATAAEYLARVVAAPELAGIEKQTGVYAGPVADTLLLVAEQRQADLIVLASHGRSGLARWALGSVAYKLTRHAPMPVLLLRDQMPAAFVAAPEREPALCVLVALDGSPLAEAALEPSAWAAVALAAPGQARLHLVRVVDQYDLLDAPQDVAVGPDWEALATAWVVNASKNYLAGVAHRIQAGPLDGQNITVSWSVVKDRETTSYERDVASAILRTAEVGEGVEGTTAPTRCELIALATHGRGGLARWVMGSITERVVEGARVPVLIVRPQNAAQV